MPNVMAALPSIGGALCSIPQFCSNVAKTRNPLKFAGVPQTPELISTAGPKFAILWGHVEEILLLNNFFPIVNRPTFLSCEDIARQSFTMVRRWRLFRDFLRPAFPASRVQHVSDQQVTPCVEVRQTSNLRPLRLGEEKRKKKERKNKPQDENIMFCPIP